MTINTETTNQKHEYKNQSLQAAILKVIFLILLTLHIRKHSKIPNNSDKGKTPDIEQLYIKEYTADMQEFYREIDHVISHNYNYNEDYMVKRICLKEDLKHTNGDIVKLIQDTAENILQYSAQGVKYGGIIIRDYNSQNETDIKKKEKIIEALNTIPNEIIIILIDDKKAPSPQLDNIDITQPVNNMQNTKQSLK